MKKIIHLILINIALLVIAYMAGSFTAASFDIKTWVAECRFFIAFITLILMAACSVAYIEETKKK